MDAYFNELSAPQNAIAPADVPALLDDYIPLIRACTARFGILHIRTDYTLSGIILRENSTLTDYIRKDRLVDDDTFNLLLTTHPYPYEQDGVTTVPSATSPWELAAGVLEGTTARGLSCAAGHHSFAIGLATTELWRNELLHTLR